MNSSSLTKTQASAAFSKKAKEIALENSLDFAVAWQRCKTENPELHAQAFGAQALDNSADRRHIYQPSVPDGRGGKRMLTKTRSADVSEAIPIPSRENIEALCLPNDATLEEFNAAYKANGGVPLRHERINAVFSALMGLCRNYSTPAEREKRTAARFPRLVPINTKLLPAALLDNDVR